MLRAFTEAEKAAERGEVPVGAVIVDKLGNILAMAGNRTLGDHDPTAHAEMIVIRETAAKLGSERLVDCDLYVTLEPCAMCAGASHLPAFGGCISLPPMKKWVPLSMGQFSSRNPPAITSRKSMAASAGNGPNCC